MEGEALVKKEVNQVTVWTQGQIELIKRTVAKGTSDDELQLFLYIAKRTGLDPFARQIYCVKRWDSTQNREVMTPQTGIDGFRLVADRTGKYAPGTITWEIVNGKTVSATATIKKLVDGVWHEVSATAYFDEYAQHKKDGSLTSMWRKMPKLMIGKCAEALVLRKAFPAELSGVYTHDEMMQADVEQKPSESGKPPTLPPQELPKEATKEDVTETPQPQGKSVKAMIVKVSSHDGLSKKSGKPYTLTTVTLDNDLELKTFDTGLQKELYQANNEGSVLKLTYDDKNIITGLEYVKENIDDTPF